MRVSLAVRVRVTLVAATIVVLHGGLQGQTGSAPSAFCHVTDGTLTVCPNSGQEWSDVLPRFFPESNSYLYADQADLDSALGTPTSPLDTFLLLYDECARTTPLGRNEYFLISFKTVEIEDGHEAVVQYVLHLFNDGTIMFFEDGVLQPPGRAPLVHHMRGHVGFGSSPNCSRPHVLAEFQIPLSIAGGGSYSPDPLFWTSFIPPRKNVVVLMTGFSGNNDSSGMEELRQMLLQHPDAILDARRFGHSQQRAALDFIRSHATSSDITLVGHSWGADSVIELAERLDAEGINVEKLVQVDSIGIGDDLLPENVLTGLNYYQTGELLNGERPVGGSTNVDAETHLGLGVADVTHTNIDNNSDIQREISDFKLNDSLPSGAGVDPPHSPTRKVAVPKPLTILGAQGLKSSALWDSGLIPLDSPVTLAERNGAIIDVDFADPVLMKLRDLTGSSQETLTIELSGTVSVPDVGAADKLEVEFQFDDAAEEFRGSQVADNITIDAASGMGTFQQTVNLTLSDVHFGGFSLEILQNGAGVTELHAIRVSIAGDQIASEVQPPPPAGGALRLFRQVTLPGDYAAAGVGLRGAPGGAIIISGVPAGATVREAFLYWGMLDNGESPALKQLNVNGRPITGTLIGSGGDTCWGRTNSFAYRADVTLEVGGNGQYLIGGVAGGGSILAQGASLVVLYERPGDPDRTVFLLDGNVVFPQVATATTTISGFLAAGTAKTTFIVGDGQPFPETARVTGGAGSVTLSNPFDGSDGALWDTDTFDVTQQVGNGSAPALVNITMQGDCLMWAAQAFSVIAGAVVDGDSDGISDAEDNCPIAANAAQVDINLNGIGDACESPDRRLGTTGFLQALLDGHTIGEQTTPVLGLEPSLLDQLIRIVTFRISSGLSHDAAGLTESLVDSLVEAGVIATEDAEQLVTDVLTAVDTSPASIEISTNTAELWPPNGKLATIAVTGRMADLQSGVDRSSAEFSVVDEYGLVQPSGHVEVAPDGTFHFSLRLEAGRRGNDFDGRRYEIVVSATDNAGNRGSVSAFVTALHDRGKK